MDMYVTTSIGSPASAECLLDGSVVVRGDHDRLRDALLAADGRQFGEEAVGQPRHVLDVEEGVQLVVEGTHSARDRRVLRDLRQLGGVLFGASEDFGQPRRQTVALRSDASILGGVGGRGVDSWPEHDHEPARAEGAFATASR